MSEKGLPPRTQNTVLNSTEIYNFFAIFGKNYLPVLNCTKIFFLIFGMDDSPLVQCQVEHEGSTKRIARSSKAVARLYTGKDEEGPRCGRSHGLNGPCSAWCCMCCRAWACICTFCTAGYPSRRRTQRRRARTSAARRSIGMTGPARAPARPESLSDALHMQH